MSGRFDTKLIAEPVILVHLVDRLPLWPSIVQTVFEAGNVGAQILIAGRLFDMDVAYGTDRPPHCPDRHPVVANVCCALWVGHDGPHAAAGDSYMDDEQFTIVGLRTPT